MLYVPCITFAAVQVFSAWSLLFRGFKPCTATILREHNGQARLSADQLRLTQSQHHQTHELVQDKRQKPARCKLLPLVVHDYGHTMAYAHAKGCSMMLWMW